MTPTCTRVPPARLVLALVGTRAQVLEALHRLDGLTWETLAAAPHPVAA